MDYNMSCDEVISCLCIYCHVLYFYNPQQGKLILKRKPTYEMWKPG